MAIAKSHFHLLLLSCLLVALPIFIDLPGHSALTQATQDAGHSVIFALIAMLVFAVIAPLNLALQVKYVLSFVIVVMLGVMVEWVQAKIGRDASISDILLDAVGAFVGLILCRARYHSSNKTILYGIAVIILLGCFAYPAIILLGVVDKYRNVPVLVDFDGLVNTNVYKPMNGAAVTIASAAGAWSDNQSDVAEIHFKPGHLWPGIELLEVFADWRAYEFLDLEVYSLESETLRLTLRVHDKAHNNEYADRFNREFMIQPGLNQLSVSLDEIKNAADSRQLDLSTIAGLIMFMTETEQLKRVQLDNIRLR